MMTKKNYCTGLMLAFFLGQAAAQQISVDLPPLGMYRHSDTITIGYSGGDEKVELRSSAIPNGGMDISHYQRVHIPLWPASGTQKFVYGTDVEPAYIGNDLKYGINYCILVSGTRKSAEFRIIMESGQAPDLQIPGNGAVITELTPEFRWSGTAPYFTILVSDEPFTIKDEKLQGINAIWQATTRSKSIRYGEAAEFGNGVDAPPLLKGKVYNWLVLNNYDPASNVISTVVSDPRSFQYSASVPQAPRLLAPANLATLTSDNPISFRWSAVTDAVSYRLDLFEKNEINENSASTAIWQQYVNNPEVVLPDPNGLLRNLTYQWRVYAFDNQGRANVSGSFSFFNDVNAGHIQIVTEDADHNRIPFVKISFDRVPGLRHPFIAEGPTDETGFIGYEHMPYRTYSITASKEGFENQTIQFDLADTSVLYFIPMPATKGNIFGKVTNSSSGNAIDNALVSVVNLDSPDEPPREALTTFSGDFSFELPYGNWQVDVTHDDYTKKPPTVVTLSRDSRVGTADFQLNGLYFKISGSVVNSFTNQKIYNASVSIKQSGAVNTFQTLGDGSFSFSSASGQAEITCRKAGFSTKTLFWNIQSDLNKTISLDPGASSVSGKVTDTKGKYQSGVTITAVSSTRELKQVTGVDGSFNLSLSAGSWKISAVKDRYTANKDHYILLEFGQDIGISFIVRKNESFVNGRVREQKMDGIYNLADAVVRVAETGASVTTDALGRYSISVDRGEFTLSAFRSGYSFPEQRKVSVGDNDTLTGVDFTGTGNAARLAGAVFTSMGPAPAVDVYAMGLNTGKLTSAKSDNQGNFEFSLNYGDYRLWALKTGYRSDTINSIHLNPGMSYAGKNLNLTKNTGLVQGAVRSGGAAIVGKNCVVNYTGTSGARSAPVTSAGEFQFELEAGKPYSVKAVCDGYVPSASQDISVAAGGAVRADFSLVPSNLVYSGQVRSSKTGLPLKGVSVTFTPDGGAAAQTVLTEDDLGGYQLNLLAGRYSVSMKKVGFVDKTKTVQLSIGVSVTGVLDTLKANEGSLTGLVSDNAGASLAGAVISLNRTGVNVVPVFSDAQGRFRFSSIPAGFYTLTAGKSNFYKETQSVFISPDFVAQVSIPMRSWTAVISGKASRPSGAGLPGVQISAQSGELSRSVFSGADGTYRFDSLPAGSYSVNAFLVENSSEPAYTGRSLGEGQVLSGLNFSLTAFTGQVTLSPAGVANTGDLRFRLVNGRTGDEYISSEDNPFYFPLPSDIYTLSLATPGYRISSSTSLAVNGVHNFPVTVAVKTVKIAGTARNQDDVAVGGLAVRLIPVSGGAGEYTVQTGSDGAFSFSGLSEGALFTMGCVASAYKCTDTNITTREASGIRLRAEDFSSRVSGAVTLDGKTASGARVLASGSGNPSRTAYTDASGKYELSGLRMKTGDSLSVTASIAGVPENMKPVKLNAGQSMPDLNFALKRVRVRYRHVLQTEDRKLAGALVAVSRGLRLDTLETDADGRFTLDSLLPGDVIVIQTLLDARRYDNAVKSVNLTDLAEQSGTTTITEHNSTVTVSASTLPVTLYINGDPQEEISESPHVLAYMSAGSYRISIGKSGYLVEPGEAAVLLDGTENTDTSLSFELTQITSGIYGTVYEIVNRLESRGRLDLTLILRDTLGTAVETQRTREDGSYHFSEVAAGAYDLKASLIGFSPVTHRLIILESGAIQQDVRLVARDQAVFGRLSSNEAFDFGDAEIVLTGISGEVQTAAAGPFGDFGFLNLQSQSAYTLKASAGALSSMDTAFVVPLGGAIRADLTLYRLAEISGRALFGGEGLPGVQITLTDRSDGKILSAVTDSSGRYSVSGIRDGSYAVAAVKSGFINLTGGLDVIVSGRDISGETDFQFTPKETGIYGIVSSDAGDAVSAEIIFITGSDTLTAVSNANGEYIIRAAPGGDYTVSVGHAAYDAFSGAFAHTETQFQEFNIQLMRKRNQVTGKVVSAFDEFQAVGGAVLHYTTVLGDTGSAVSEAGGRYVVAFVSDPGASVMFDSIVAEGYEVLAEQEVLLNGLGSGVQVFRLMPVFTDDGEVRVTILEKGDTVSGTQITLMPDAQDLEPQTQSENPAVFASLRVPGKYSIQVVRPGYPDMFKYYSLTPSLKSVDDVLSYPSSQYRVKVTAGGMMSLAAKVFVNDMEAFEDTAVSGLYLSPDDLTAGDYEISVSPMDKSRLPLNPYMGRLGTDETKTDDVRFPWILQALADTVLGASVEPGLKLTSGSNVQAFEESASGVLFFRYQGTAEWDSVSMRMIAGTGSENSYFRGRVPELDKPGTLQYYFRILWRDGIASDKGRSVDAVYTNAGSPLSFAVADPNVLKAVSFDPLRLESDSTLAAGGSVMKIGVNLSGKNARKLNGYFDANVAAKEDISISWSFREDEISKSLKGSKLEPDANSPRSVLFTAGDAGTLSIYCTVRMKDVTLQKRIDIIIRDLKAARIAVRFDDENRMLVENSAPLALNNRNTQGYHFSAVGYTKQNEEFYISPFWMFDDSTLMADSNAARLAFGLFIPEGRVAGVDTLTVEDQVSGERFRTAIQTFLQVEPAEAETVTVGNGKGAGLEIPLGGLQSPVRVDFSVKEVSKLLTTSPKTEVAGEIVNIELTPPQPFRNNQGAYVSLPMGKKARTAVRRNAKVFVGHWNPKRLAWDELETDEVRSSDSVVVALARSFSPFALQLESMPLGAYDFKVMPNPFTPSDPWALQFQYDVSSQRAASVGIEVEVFNMRGDRVYKSHKAFVSKADSVAAGTFKQSEDPTQAQRLGELSPYLWDGRTTDGRLCRNGRYVLKLTVSDPEETKSYLRKVVLLK